MEVAEATIPPFAVQVLTPRNAVAVKPGDRLVGSFWIRAEPVGGSTPEVPGFLFSDEQKWTQLAWIGTKPGPEWEEQTFGYTADRDFPAGSIAGNFHLGTTPQVVEIAGFTVEVEKADPDAAPTPDALANPIDPRLVDLLGPDADLIISGNVPAEFSGPGPAPGTTRSLVEVEDQPFEQATVVNVGKATPKIWDSQLTSPASTGPVSKGDVLFGMIDVRATSEKESGGGQFTAWLQSNTPGDGWHGFRKLEGAPGRAWSRRYFAAEADRDAAAGEVDLVFQLGVIPQEFAVANMLVWNLGPDADLALLPRTRLTYEGQERDAPWRTEADDRIQQHRMGDLAVLVVDADGEPVEGAEVRVELRDRDFEIGTFLNNRFPGLDDDADGRKFTQVVQQHFNRVTCPSYGAEGWGWPDPGTRKNYLATIDWATSQPDLTVKAHPIVWSRFDYMPKRFSDAKGNPAKLRAEIKRFVTEVATILGENGVEEVDALNEPIGFTAFDDIIDDPGLRAEWFLTAHEAAPSMRLLINEHSILSAGGLDTIKQDNYLRIIQDLLDRGVPLAGIGFQGHIGEDFTPPTQLWKVLDRFAIFGLPLHITELDINTEDQETQADYLRDFMTAMYAHPAVKSVTLWGFWGGAMWIPQAELWRENWTMKPGAHALVELTGQTLHTDATVTTGPGGTAGVRGHAGSYAVTSGGVEQEVELTPEGATVVLQLK